MAAASWIIVAIIFVASVMGHPARNSLLDKVTANDIAANSVQPTDQKTAANTEDKKPSTVQITGATVGAGEPDIKYPDPRSPSMLARILDDIFQIPISVLQAVARLVTNPFTQHNKVPGLAGKN